MQLFVLNCVPREFERERQRKKKNPSATVYMVLSVFEMQAKLYWLAIKNLLFIMCFSCILFFCVCVCAHFFCVCASLSVCKCNIYDENPIWHKHQTNSNTLLFLARGKKIFLRIMRSTNMLSFSCLRCMWCCCFYLCNNFFFFFRCHFCRKPLRFEDSSLMDFSLYPND